jgi:hypothetical protein
VNEDDPSSKACRIWSPAVGFHASVIPTTPPTMASTVGTSSTTTSTNNAISRHSLFNSTELVTLNVGGHSFTTTRSTLFSVPGSFLEAMFSGRHAFCAQQTADGAYFIDRDGRFVEK